MIQSDFYGNSFVWWSGIVEDRNDPLKLGRVRVRVFGLHSENTTRIPTDSLPWAQIMVPTTGGQTNAPKPGDWVMGFFQDGANAQLPVVMGVYLGVDSNTSIVYESTETTPGKPKPPGDTVIRKSGEPVTPRTNRGVMWNTTVNRTNQNREHVCDVTTQARAFVSKVRAAFGTIVEQIKQAIRAVLMALGIVPDGGMVRSLINFMQKILAYVRKIKAFLQEIIDIKNVFLALVTKIRNMIAYIMSLPARVLKFLRECISQFLASLTKELSSLFAPSGLGGGNLNNPFKELKETFNELRSEVTDVIAQIVDIASTPAQLLDVLTTAPTDEEIARGGEDIATLFGSEGGSTFDNLKETIGTVSISNGIISTTPGLAAVRLASEFNSFTDKLKANDPVKIQNIETTPSVSNSPSVQGRNSEVTTSGPSSLPSDTFMQDMANFQSNPLAGSAAGQADFSQTNKLVESISDMAVSAFPSRYETVSKSERLLNRPATP